MAGMALLHCLEAYARGNLMGVQSTQRDWSPYLAHFTQWSAMRELRALLKRSSAAPLAPAAGVATGEPAAGGASGAGLASGSSAASQGPEPIQARVDRLLDVADGKSWQIVTQILDSRRLLARSPGEKHFIPPCVCLSECTLPGLVSLAERYGRFGFVFSKREVFDAGGRPCLYVGRDEYTALAQLGRARPIETPEGRLYALSNIYEPPRSGAKPQDYTHEREWRVFGDVAFETTALRALVAPTRYVPLLLERLPGVSVIPIDMLFSWGA